MRRVGFQSTGASASDSIAMAASGFAAPEPISSGCDCPLAGNPVLIKSWKASTGLMVHARGTGVVSLRACASWRLRSAMRSLKVPTAPEGSVSGAGPLRERRLSPERRVFFSARGEDAPLGDEHRLAAGAHVELLNGDTNLPRNVFARPQRTTRICSLGNNEDRSAASTRGYPGVQSLRPECAWGIDNLVGAFADRERRVEEIGRDLHVNHGHAREHRMRRWPSQSVAEVSGRNAGRCRALVLGNCSP